MPVDTQKDFQPAKEEPLLELSGLGLNFEENNRHAFRNIGLRVRKGEFISIIGPSGCGKSTLLKTIAGLIEPTAGEVSWKNRTRPEGAFIFQDPTLLPWLTTMGNVEVPLRLRKVEKTKRRSICEQAIEKVLLKQSTGDYPKNLSGGMKMRVSLARAMTLHPELLYLDEPFGALDAITRNQMNQLLLSLKKDQGWTALMVTHSVNEAVFMSDRVLVMTHSPGTILEEIKIDLPTERDESVQMSSNFLGYVQQIKALIRKEIA